MKNQKFIFLLSILFLLTFTIFSDEYAIYISDGYVYNDVWGSLTKTQFAIKYDDEEEIFYLYSQDYLTKGWIHYSLDDIQTFRNALNKYIEWEKTAIDNKVTIEKNLPISILNSSVSWNYGDEWYFGSGLSTYFSFFSQSEERHQLVIFSNKIESDSNEYIDFKIDPIYLDKNHVISLLEGISEKSMKKVINEHEKNKKNEDLFQ
ncbi:MAG TPA: hypothetical protein PLG34_00560 [Spirochaetota bacterium]|nr:hypothetical protein [Spirochaetota bacterium]HPY86458.1 hypothetical protein [Spirochaetota bacterium]HQH31466.1 hypothetical protein [Spirochaetota bacterium]HRU45108.1 hypothetical protein [Spirochaetota bacterium]